MSLHALAAASTAEFSAEEMDFMAQQQMVQIVRFPTVITMPSIAVAMIVAMTHIFSTIKAARIARSHLYRNFGPFRARQPIEVPLWLAAELKKDGRCDMIAPAWLSVDGLKAVITNEKSDTMLENVHLHYQEIASSILRHDPTCVPDADRVRSLLKDLEQLREAKILATVKQVALTDRNQQTAPRFTNFSLMELNVIRSTMLSAVDRMEELDVDAMNARAAVDEINREI